MNSGYESLQLSLLIASFIATILVYRGIVNKDFFYTMRAIFITYVVSILFFVMGSFVVKNLYAFTFYPSYTATIVKVDKSYHEDDLLYQATVKFYDKNRKVIIQKNSTSVSYELFVGNKIEVLYKDGFMLEYSFASFILSLVFLIISIILLFVLWHYFYYAIGKNNDIVYEYAGKYFIVILLPTAVSGFLGSLLYVMWQVVQGEKSFPTFGIVLILFFILVLIPFCYVVFKNAYLKSIKLFTKESDTKKIIKHKKYSKQITQKKYEINVDNSKNIYTKIDDSSLRDIMILKVIGFIFAVIIVLNLTLNDDIGMITIFINFFLAGTFIYVYVTRKINITKFGAISASFETNTMFIGSKLQGFIEFSLDNKFKNNSKCTVTLRNIYRYEIRDNHGDYDTKYKVIYEKEIDFRIKNNSLDFKIPIPNNTYCTDEEYSWKFILESAVKGVDLYREYDIIINKIKG